MRVAVIPSPHLSPRGRGRKRAFAVSSQPALSLSPAL